MIIADQRTTDYRFILDILFINLRNGDIELTVKAGDERFELTPFFLQGLASG